MKKILRLLTLLLITVFNTGLMGQPVTFTNSTSTVIPRAINGVITTTDIPIVVSGISINTISSNPQLNAFQSAFFNITQQLVDHLVISLVAPSGESVVLSSNNGGAGNGYVNSTFTRPPPGNALAVSNYNNIPIPATRQFIPQNGAASWDNLIGATINGTWLLRIVHNGTGTTYNGTFHNVTLTFNEHQCSYNPVNISNTTCTGNNGNITLSVVGGYIPYSYSWSNGSGMSSQSNVTTGTYAVTVTDAYNCTTTANYTIGNTTSNLAIDLSNISATTCGLSNGTVTYTIANGYIPTYTFDSINIPTSGTISNLEVGTHTLSASASGGCIINQNVNIRQSNSIAISITNTAESCGLSNGTATVNPAGLSYLWSNAQTTRIATGLTFGLYTVTATNSSGCSSSASVYIPNSTVCINPDILFVPYGGTGTSNVTSNDSPNFSTIDTTIIGPYNGTASIDSNGVFTYTANPNFTGLDSFVYTTYYPNGLSLLGTCVINVSDTCGNYFSDYIYSASCGTSGSSISVIQLNSTASLSYQWSNGETTNYTGSLAPGNYVVTIVDSIGCSVTRSYNVGNSPLSIGLAITPNSCTGANDGIIDLSVYGTAPYSYAWSNASATGVLMNVPEGIYTVTVTDATGCTGSATANVQATNILPPVTLNVVPISCFGTADGSISIANPTAGLVYNWSNGSTVASLSNLNAGNYTVTVSNSNGCSSTAGATLTEPAVLSTSSSNTPSCNQQPNGSITLNTTGGTAPYAYAWAQGIWPNNTQDSLLAGTYTISVTDSHNCTTTIAAVVPTYTQQVTFTGNTILCPNTSVTINAACATSNCYYTWSNFVNSASVSFTQQGTYFVTMTDANGCTAATSIYIDSVAVCANNPPIANYDIFTTFEDRVLNANILSNDYDFEGQTLILNIQPITAPLHGAAVLNGNGQFSYYPQSGFVGQDSFQYQICDSNIPQACANGWAYITVQPCFDVNSIQQTAMDCNTGFATMTIAVSNNPNPLNYALNYANGQLFSNQIGTFNNLTSTTGCTLYIYDAYTGCNVTIDTLSVPFTYSNMTPSSNTPPDCLNNTLRLEYPISGTPTVEITGGTSYLINYNPLRLTLMPSPNDYYVKILINGCGDIDTFHIDGVANPVYHPSYDCTTGLGSVYGTLGAGVILPLSYYWDNGSTDTFALNLNPGLHSVTVVNGTGCTRVDEFDIVLYSTFGLQVTKVNDNCGQGIGSIHTTLTGTPSGALTYIWSNGATSADLNNLQGGTYAVTVSDASGCQFTASYTISNISPFQLLTSTQPNTCTLPNGAVGVTAIGTYPAPLTYHWQNNANTAFVTGLSAGTYTVSVNDASGCTATSSVVVTSVVPFTANVAVNTAYCSLSNGYASVSLSGTPTSPITYNWGTAQNTPSVNNLAAGTHNVTITDANNCVLTKTFVIGNAQSFSTTFNTFPSNCSQANGSIYLIVGGSPLGAIQYTWAAPLSGNTPTQTNLLPGTYTVTITDGFCTEVKSIQVISNNYFNFNINATTTDCNINTGTATVNALPAFITNPVYAWSNAQTTPTATGLAEGGYSVTITSGTCVAHQNIGITRDLNCFVSISGRVLDDNINQTCVTNTQLGIANKHVYITGPNSYAAHDYTDNQGNYQFYAPVPGNFNIQLISTVNANEMPYIPICFTQRSVNVPVFNSPSTGNDFYMKLDTFRNLRCYVNSAQGTNQGIPREYTICTKNLGGVPEDGISSLTWDSHLSNFFPISTPNTVDLLNHTSSYVIPTLQPGQEICRTLRLAVDPTTAIGTNLYSLGASLPISWDRYPLNNYAPYYQTVTGSYDPNDKSVSPAGDITASDSILTYTIRFQNVGTDTAFNITIRDTLNAASYDLNTIHPISWSHNFDLNMEGDNILVFNFDNIRLVDSFHNEPASHGYVSFTIRRKSDLPIGARISNRASIYFDYNEPVRTNAATNDIINGVNEVVDHSIPMTIMPNPSNGTSVLVYDLAESNTVTLSVTDALGRSIYTPILQEFQQAGQHAYDLSKLQLPAGLWFVSLRTNEGNSAVSRWLIVD